MRNWYNQRRRWLERFMRAVPNRIPWPKVPEYVEVYYDDMGIMSESFPREEAERMLREGKLTVINGRLTRVFPYEENMPEEETLVEEEFEEI